MTTLLAVDAYDPSQLNKLYDEWSNVRDGLRGDLQNAPAQIAAMQSSALLQLRVAAQAFSETSWDALVVPSSSLAVPSPPTIPETLAALESVRARLDWLLVKAAARLDWTETVTTVLQLHACAKIAEEWKIESTWPQLSRARTLLRDAAAANLAEALKAISWPPRFSADASSSAEDSKFLSKVDCVARAAAGLILLQAWSAQWHSELPPTPPIPSLVLPMLWVMQVVSKPLVARLRRLLHPLIVEATEKADAARLAPAIDKLPSTVAPVRPPAVLVGSVPAALWAAGLSPQWITAIALGVLHDDVRRMLSSGNSASCSGSGALHTALERGASLAAAAWLSVVAFCDQSTRLLSVPTAADFQSPKLTVGPSGGFAVVPCDWLGLVAEQVSMELARVLDSALASEMRPLGGLSAQSIEPKAQQMQALRSIASGGDENGGSSRAVSELPSGNTSSSSSPQLLPDVTRLITVHAIDCCAQFDDALSAALLNTSSPAVQPPSASRVVSSKPPPAAWRSFEARFLIRRPCSLSQFILQCQSAKIDVPGTAIALTIRARASNTLQRVAFCEAALLAELVRDVLSKILCNNIASAGVGLNDGAHSLVAQVGWRSCESALLEHLVPWFRCAVSRYTSLPDVTLCALADSLSAVAECLLAELCLACVHASVGSTAVESAAVSVGGLVKQGWGGVANAAAVVMNMAQGQGGLQGSASSPGEAGVRTSLGGGGEGEDAGPSLVGFGGLARMLWQTVKRGADVASGSPLPAALIGGPDAGSASIDNASVDGESRASDSSGEDGAAEGKSSVRRKTTRVAPSSCDIQQTAILRSLLAVSAEAEARFAAIERVSGRQQKNAAPLSKQASLHALHKKHSTAHPHAWPAAMTACRSAVTATTPMQQPSTMQLQPLLAWACGTRMLCAALALLESLPRALEAIVLDALASDGRTPVAWDFEGVSPPTALSPSRAFAQFAGAAVPAIAGVMLSRFAETARPWLFFANAWRMRSYAVSLSPVDAADLSRGSLLQAAVELAAMCGDVASWQQSQGQHASLQRQQRAYRGLDDGAGEREGSDGVAAAPLDDWMQSVCTAVWAGLDSLLFQAVAHPAGIDTVDRSPAARSAGRARLDSEDKGTLSAPLPAGCRHILASLVADVSGVASILSRTCSAAPESVISGGSATDGHPFDSEQGSSTAGGGGNRAIELRSVLPAVSCIASLLELPPSKARMLRTTLIDIMDLPPQGSSGTDMLEEAGSDASSVAAGGDVVASAVGWAHTGRDAVPLCRAPYIFVCPRLLLLPTSAGPIAHTNRR